MIGYFRICICLFLSSCMGIFHEEDSYSKFSKKITSEYIKEISRDGKLSVTGIGGRITEDVQTVYLFVDTVLSPDIDTARQLFVEMEEKYLRLLNASDEIKPYLHHHPNGIEAFELMITFIKPNRSFVNPPYIGLVSLTNGKVYYEKFTLEKKFFETVHTEPYEEAYRIVYGKDKNDAM